MWLCVRFPLLSLESLWQVDGSQDVAVAIVEQHRLIACNQTAYRQGIRQGQSVSTGYALCGSLRVIDRDPIIELQQLNAQAAIAYPFSSMLCVQPPNCLLIEIGRSLTLFGGLTELLQQLRGCFLQQALTFNFAIGPTPKSAQVFCSVDESYSMACWNGQQQILDEGIFQQHLSQMSVEAMALPADVLKKCHTLGLKTIGALMQLPRPAMAKRFGRATEDYCQQLLGERADVRPYYQPPVIFVRDAVFVDVLHHHEALLFPIRRLLDELIRFLRVYQKSCQLLAWRLVDSYRVCTDFEVHLADVQMSQGSFLELTRLKLDTIRLTGPIESVSLRVTQLNEVALPAESLFASSEAFNNDLHFVSKIRARLGQGSCYWLQSRDHVVPELAVKARVGSASEPVNADFPLRPSWLLSCPQAIGKEKERLFWQGRLNIVSSEERIQHYWWKKTISRDYFVAQHDSGVMMWIFFDHQKQHWFVHGIFA